MMKKSRACFHYVVILLIGIIGSFLLKNESIFILPYSSFSNFINPYFNFKKNTDEIPEQRIFSRYIQKLGTLEELYKANITLAVIALPHVEEEGCSANASLATGNANILVTLI